jgi:ankyrin repeat protein
MDSGKFLSANLNESAPLPLTDSNLLFNDSFSTNGSTAFGENSVSNMVTSSMPYQTDSIFHTNDPLSAGSITSSDSFLLTMHMQSMQFADREIRRLKQIIQQQALRIQELESSKPIAQDTSNNIENKQNSPEIFDQFSQDASSNIEDKQNSTEIFDQFIQIPPADNNISTFGASLENTKEEPLQNLNDVQVEKEFLLTDSDTDSESVTSKVSEFSLISSDSKSELFTSEIQKETTNELFRKLSEQEINTEKYIAQMEDNKKTLNDWIKRQEDIEIYKERETDYQKQISDLSDELKKIESEAENLKRQQKVDLENMEIQKTQLEESNVKIESLETELKQEKDNYFSLEQSKNKEIKELQQQIKDFTKTVKNQQKEIKKQKADHERVLNETINNTVRANQASEKKINSLQQQLKEANIELESQKTQLEESNTKIKALEIELDQEKNNYFSLEQRKGEEIRGLQQQIKDFTKTVKNQQKEIKKQKADHERVLNETINNTEMTNKESKKRINFLQKQLEKANIELKSQKEQQGKANTEIKALETELKQEKNNYFSLEQSKNKEIQELQQQKNDLIKIEQGLNNEIAILNQTQKRKRSDFENEMDETNSKRSRLVFQDQLNIENTKYLPLVPQESYDEFKQALKEANTSKIQSLVSKYPQLVVKIDRQGWTPLMRIICNKEIDNHDKYTTVQAVLEANEEVNKKSKRSVKFQNSMINRREFSGGSTALSMAVIQENEAVVELLLKYGANPNIQNKNEWTPLMYAADKRHKNIAEMLLKHYANPNNQSREGGTVALHLAILNTDEDIVKLLLKNKADPNVKDSSGWTSLMKAVESKHTGIAESLLNYGVKINEQEKRGNTALHQAVSKKDEKMVKRLLEEPKTNPNIQNKDGWTPLILSAEYGYPEITKELINCGADLYQETIHGYNALMRAMLSKKIKSEEIRKDIIKIIIEADPRIIFYKNAKGYSAFDTAGYHELTDIKALLLKHKTEWENLCKGQ